MIDRLAGKWAHQHGGTDVFDDCCEWSKPTICDCCGEPVHDRLAEYQSHVGKLWRGHMECTTAEAAKWVMVERADVLWLTSQIKEGYTPDPDAPTFKRLHLAVI